MIERGPRYSALQDFNDNELEMIRKLYKEGGLQQTKRFDLTILQGECVGGLHGDQQCDLFSDAGAGAKSMDERFRPGSRRAERRSMTRVGEELEIGTLDPIGVNTRVEAVFRAGVAGYNAANAERCAARAGDLAGQLPQ